MIVLWNTLYINAALEQLVREGRDVTSEDVARLSPLVFEHINLLGRYAFSVPEAVTRGELRPLRNPAEVLEEVATPPRKAPLVWPAVSSVAATTGTDVGSLLVSKIKNVGSITGPVKVT